MLTTDKKHTYFKSPLVTSLSKGILFSFIQKGRYMILLLFLSSNIFSQSNQFVFRQLGLENGLSQNSVVAIAQDSLGFLWFATQDGLNRYDGIEFQYYEKYFWDITRQDKTVLGQLMVDKKGTLWILPDTGIPEFYDLTKNDFEVYEDLKNIRCFFQNKSGDYFFGTQNDGLIIHRSNENTKQQILRNRSILNGLVSRNNQLWLVTENAVLHSKDFDIFDTLAFVDANNTPISPRITCLLEDYQGNIWAGSFGNGLFIKEKDARVFRAYQQNDLEIKQLKILSLFEDHHQKIWIGTYGQGAFLLDNSKNNSQQFKAEKYNPNALAYNDILSITEDKSGNIWLGTDGAGLSFYDENLSKFNGFTNSQVPSNIQIDVVRSLLVDKKNKTWVGTSGKGLTVYDATNSGKNWHTYTTQNSNLSSNRIMSLEEGPDGLIYIGTQGKALDIFNPATNTFINIGSDIIRDHTIWDIHIDQENRIWLATRNEGLLEFDKEKGILHQYEKFNSLITGNNIRSIINGKNKNELWIGTEDNGICHFDKTTQIFTAYQNVINSNKIKCLYLSDDGLLWIGTNGNGLEVLNTKTNSVSIYNTMDGLPNNVIYGILADAENNLWLSSNRGICKFIPPENIEDTTSIPVSTIYDNYDGLQSFEFNTGASFKDKKGNLYFGGVEGYNWFNPQKINANPNPPDILLTDLVADGQSYFSTISSKEKGTLELKYEQNDLSFSFSATSFSLPERNQYRYQLLGYDEAEIEAGNRHFAQYTNLPEGDYEFIVKASNYDGIWNEKGLQVAIKILPPWFRTWWAYLLYALFLGGIVYALYRFQKRRWELKSSLANEQAEAQRLKEIDEMKTRLYTNITHEFRTPLTVILNLAEELRMNPKIKWEKRIKTIQRNGSQLLDLINQMLDLSKLQEGSIEANYIQGDVIKYLRYLTESYQSMAMSQNKKLSFLGEPAEFMMDYDTNKLHRILENLLSNAIKFTPGFGTIKISVYGKETALWINVEDTGIGISQEKIPHVFDRFYQVDNTNTREEEGTGIGLALVKEMVELLKGRIEVESEINKGTAFKIILPVHRNALIEEIDFGKSVQHSNESVFQDTVKEPLFLDENKPILLIVEDNMDVLEYLQDSLFQNYNILTARNGIEGLKIAQEKVPDIIISDVMMPHMDGFELCEKLKTDPRTNHIPIILLTAKVTHEDRLTGLSYGADAYLSKPFDKKELVIRLEQLITLRRSLQEKYSKEEGLSEEEALSTNYIFIKKVRDIIHQHLTEETFQISDLCQAINLSRTQLHRKLKALTGKSTSEFIKNIRLQKGQLLLQTTDLNISEIAYQIGYKYPNHFSTDYKNHFGHTPQESRKR